MDVEALKGRSPGRRPQDKLEIERYLLFAFLGAAFAQAKEGGEETTGKKRDRSFAYQAYLNRLRVGTDLEMRRR
jgi:hypothetical protein